MHSLEELSKSICRLCLKFENSKKMVSLLDNTDESGLSTYAKGVSKLTKVVINKLDALPNNMCLNCLHLLKQAVYFKLQCEHTDKCLRNIARGHSENQDIKQAIVDFAKRNFYLDYKYSFQSTIKKKNKCDNNKSNIRSESDNIAEDNLQYDTDSLMNSAIHSDTEEATLIDHPIPETCTVNSNPVNVPIENNANYIIVKPLEISISTQREHIEEDKSILSVMEQLFVPKECNIPLSKLAKLQKKQRTSAAQKSNDFLKEMEEMFATFPCDTPSDPNDDDIRPRYRRMRFKRRGGHLDIQNEQKKNIVCKVCGKVLANPNTYRCHMERHTGCRYICEHCGKGFPILKELQIHQVCRHGTGPYIQCSQCPFKAPRRLELIEHERIHSGERPFTCEKCGLTFRRRGIWKKHLIYHAEKTVQCPQCNKKFFQRGAMLAHANNVHERMYVYMCHKCGATYAKNSTVRRHMTERHGIPREAQGKITRIKKISGYQEQSKE